MKTLPTWLRYALVAGLVCVSGCPVLTIGRFEPALLTLAFVLTLLMIRQRAAIISPPAMPVFAAFAGILLIQAIMFAFVPVVTIVGFMVRLYVAYATVRVVGDFPRLYVNVLSVLAAVSLAFYAVDTAVGLAGAELRTYLPQVGALWDASRPYNLIVHNFAFSESLPYRNAGVFWEPTAFAGYLILAIVVLGLRRDEFGAGYRKRLALLSVCVLSTFSTTGYVVLAPALLLHLRVGSPLAARSPVRVPTYLAILGLAAGALMIWQAGFVGDKIVRQYQQAIQRQEGSQINRFGTLLFDWQYIGQRPWLGWGIHHRTRYSLHSQTTIGTMQGNGMSDFMAKFGLVGFGVFAFCTLMGFVSISGGRMIAAMAGLGLVVLLLNSETFLNHPLFMALMFMPLARSGWAPQRQAFADRRGLEAVA